MADIPQSQRIEIGQQYTYYPRRGKAGHLVTVLSIRPHLLHRAWVRFRYQDGREKEVAISRFYLTAD
jgi:hypothetical protein